MNKLNVIQTATMLSASYASVCEDSKNVI